MNEEPKEIHIGELLENIASRLHEASEKKAKEMVKKQFNSEKLVDLFKNFVKSLPDGLSDASVQWEHPNKVIVTFNKVKAKQKVYSVLEVE